MTTPSNWICIHKTSSRFEAEAIRGNLDANGIACVVMNKQDSSYISIGYFEIHVPEQEATRALTFLSNTNEQAANNGL
jgi:hypothetical protein